MVKIRTRYARLADLSLDCESANVWLSPTERSAYHTMRSASRQRSWLAGRILAKQLVLEELQHASLPAEAIHIESKSNRPGHGERPVVFVEGKPLVCALSIAHSSRGALAAIKLDNKVILGIDLVETDQSSEHLTWTFSATELAWLATAGSEQSTRIWAMKEAIYKACQKGEGFAPQAIEAVPGRAPRYPDFDTNRDLASLQCWRVDGHVAALAVTRTLPSQTLPAPLPQAA